MASNRIVLISVAGRHEEAVAVGICSPGHLLKIDSAGKVLKHATLGGTTERLFAKEDALQGKTKADAYAVGDVVSFHVAAPGDEINALLKPGVSYAIGDDLVSAGDGTLQKASALASAGLNKQVVATVKEALNLSATGAVAALGVVRVR
jgi:hypothetical protein